MSAASFSPSTGHVRVEGISKSFADRRVLTDISFTVSSGERVGLIGENGSGKSTLLRIVAGLLTPDAGEVSMALPGGGTARIGLLHQEPPFAARDTVEDALEAAVAPVRAAAAALDHAAEGLARSPEDDAASRAYSVALDEAERLGAWEVDTRVAETLAGLGLADLPRERETGRLSGGQRARLALAWLLLSGPDVLLLDEPTNHLDDAATSYLRGVLAAWAGPVLIASHDRAFLDTGVTALIDLDPAPVAHSMVRDVGDGGAGSGIGVTRFRGTYSDYLHARLDARERWERRYREEQDELKRLRAAVRSSHTVGHADWTPRTEVRAAAKFYADRNSRVVSRRVNDATARLEELEDSQVRKPPPELFFRGLTAAPDTVRPRRRWSGPVLSASHVAVTGRLAPVSLTASAGEKWLITGANGSGKSTLLRVLAGWLDPSEGHLSGPASLRVGMLAQEVTLADPQRGGSQRTAIEAYEDLVGGDLAQRVPLSTFGLLPGRDMNRPLRVLSLGQQRRVELAALLADPPDVLLLDEPSNHLSLVLTSQLEAAIPSYPGIVIVASHDLWLRQHWTGERLHLEA